MSAPKIGSSLARRTGARLVLGAGLAALVTAALVPAADAAHCTPPAVGSPSRPGSG